MPTMIVEDGSQVPGANSYCDLAFANEYNALIGNIDWAGDDATLEAALMQATMSIDTSYASEYASVRLGSEQALEWPRFVFADKNYVVRKSDVIPVELKRAVSQQAYKILTGTAQVFPSVSTASKVKRKKTKVDVIETEAEYFAPVEVEKFEGNTDVELLLNPLLKSKSSQTFLRR